MKLLTRWEHTVVESLFLDYPGTERQRLFDVNCTHNSFKFPIGLSHIIKTYNTMFKLWNLFVLLRVPVNSYGHRMLPQFMGRTQHWDAMICEITYVK